MRPLSLDDAIQYNLRDGQLTGVIVLDGPADMTRIIAGVSGLVEKLPGFREVAVRRGLWWYARPPSPVDIAKHVFRYRDDRVRTVDDLVPLLEALRRSRIGGDRPAWRFVVLNPAGSAPAGALSAVFFQMRHGLGDAMRAIQAVASMDAFEPTAEHAAIARHVAPRDIRGAPAEIAVHDAGLSLMQIPRADIRRDGDASIVLTAVASAAVSDAVLFPGAQPLRGNVARTRLTRRRAGDTGVGNFLRTETLTSRQKKARLAIPGLAKAQELEISQWAVATLPRPLAQMMMQVWFGSFDAIATLLPVPRTMRLGGRAVTATFGVPHLWRPVPLLLLVSSDGTNYNFTVIPGRGFSGDRAALHARIRRLITVRKASPSARQNA